MNVSPDIAHSKIAIFIDAENTKPDLEALLLFCNNYGTVESARIYGSHYLLNNSSWQEEYVACRFTPVFSIRGMPNNADMLLIVDAMELAHSRSDIDTFIIASVDTDFIPLIRRLREYGKTTIGVSTRYPPTMLSNCYHSFHRILRPQWDTFEYCSHLFYLSYLERQVQDGWALPEDVLYSLPEPLHFLKLLHKNKHDSFIGFLKESRFYNIWCGAPDPSANIPRHCWINNPRRENFFEPTEQTKLLLRDYAYSYFAKKPQAIVSGVPTLIHHLQKLQSPS